MADCKEWHLPLHLHSRLCGVLHRSLGLCMLLQVQHQPLQGVKFDDPSEMNSLLDRCCSLAALASHCLRTGMWPAPLRKCPSKLGQTSAVSLWHLELRLLLGSMNPGESFTLGSSANNKSHLLQGAGKAWLLPCSVCHHCKQMTTE